MYWPSVKCIVTHLREDLGRLQRARFTLNPEFTLGATEIKYQGHTLSLRRIQTLPDRTAAIQRYPHPTNLRDLRRFMGMVGFYARSITVYSRKNAVLHGLNRKDVQFVWRSEHQAAFESVK